MSTHSYKKFEELNSDHLPDKMTIYQDCLNEFNESPINPKRCRLLISRLLRLLSMGETFPKNEATTLFFSISKLFQHPNDSLRQIVYLSIKELCSISEDTLMATSSIMKDIQNGSDLVKPNAIRSLIRVLDESTAFSAERLLKSSVVNKNPSISSAALVSSYHFLPVADNTIKRFINETQEAVTDLKNFLYPSGSSEYYPTSSFISQYHALGLLYQLKYQDKVALLKLIQQFSGPGVLKNQLAQVYLIRIAAELVKKDHQLINQFIPMLKNGLDNKYESVQLETCRLVALYPKFVSNELFASSIQILQGLLSVPRTTTKFSALRLLNKISITHPEKIIICNPELESLVNDSNRNISTYAITTLLKTGTLKNIPSLIKTITVFIHEVSDDFKITIIDVVRTLSLKFPEEWELFLTFLIDSLKSGEGGCEFKNSIIEALLDLIQFVPCSKDLALEHLCDFIEDCEFNEILVRILHLLGKEGPTTKNPSLYVRHIYNRVVLENSIIRSAAVVALSKFALVKNDKNLVESIEILLKRIQSDQDDEVRDRASIALTLTESIKNKEKSPSEILICPVYSYDMHALENRLIQYISVNEDGFVTPFDPSGIPKYTDDERKAIELKRKQESLFDMTSELKEKEIQHTQDEFSKLSSSEQQEDLLSTKYVDELLLVEQFKSFGPLTNTSRSISLTEAEAEFIVTGVKHIFSEHIVLHFNITNTLTDVVLENVMVASEPQDPETKLMFDFSIQIERLMPGETAASYICYSKPDQEIVTENFFNNLTFTTLELDPSTDEPFDGDSGFQDEYEIDTLFLQTGDYIKSSFIGDFSLTMSQLPYEEVAVYNLREDSALEDLVDKLILTTNCLPLDNSQSVATDSTSHTLKLFGKSVIDGSHIALLVKMIKSSKGIAVKAQCKSDNAELCTRLANDLM